MVTNSVRRTEPARQNPSVRVIGMQNLSKIPALWSALQTQVTHMVQGGMVTLEVAPKGFWGTYAQECLAHSGAAG